VSIIVNEFITLDVVVSGPDDPGAPRPAAGLLTFPTVLGTGERLLPAGGPPAYLECPPAAQVGAAVRTRYRMPR
jgi:hypothetical protein